MIGQHPNTINSTNIHHILISSTISNYNSSQIGLAVKLSGVNTLQNYHSSVHPKIMFNINKDILSSMDTEFLTYISKDIFLQNHYLNFFTSIN